MARPAFDYSQDFASVDFRRHPELYRVGRGEQGVLLVQPYKSEKGHDGHPENERCDRLADAATARIAATPPPATSSDSTNEQLDVGLFATPAAFKAGEDE